jgi:peptidoglycan/LPS O-acetylase OafA/YrhL
MVVIHHSRGTLLPVDLTVPAIEAVSFFFVLSGFILTYSYHQRDYTIRAFYTARLTRIMPLTVLSVVLFFVLNQQTPNIANPDELAVMASNLLLTKHGYHYRVITLPSMPWPGASQLK